jgi:hypothetical protein
VSQDTLQRLIAVSVVLNASLDGCQAIFLGIAMKQRQDPLGFVPAIAALAKDSIEVLHSHLPPMHVLLSKDSELLMMIPWRTMTVLTLLLVSAARQVMAGQLVHRLPRLELEGKSFL